MMRIRLLPIGIAALTFVALAICAATAMGADRGTATATINGAHISIDYGRPALRGRDMLKQIKPGELWRIGANAPTTLEMDKELSFGGTSVPKGKHILLARLDEPGKWTLVFSSKSVFDYDPSAKIAEVPLSFREANNSDELVTIRLIPNGGSGVLEIAWGKMRLSATFTPR